jgi:hypothetical protein
MAVASSHEQRQGHERSTNAEYCDLRAFAFTSPLPHCFFAAAAAILTLFCSTT